MRFASSVLVLSAVMSTVLHPPMRLALAHSRYAAPAPLAAVRYVYRGLGIRPPNAGMHAGKKKDPLYDRYGLQTRYGQKASIGFHDGTVLHINQQTDAVLSAHVTHVNRGEVAEYLAPGTNHKVATAAAIASAIGTTYDVKSDGVTTTFTVLHGALQVRNARGHVVVKSNHQTTVIPNQPPAAPTPADARAVFSWTQGIPTPDLGEDVALDANGGSVVQFSSEREGSGDTGKAFHIDDGLLSQGWQSGQGQVTNQSITVGFGGGNFYRISDVIIDPHSTDGPASEDLKNFTIRVSTTDTNPNSFAAVFHGTAKQKKSLQKFHLPVPVRAKYVQLVADSNYGSRDRVAVAEMETVATTSLFAQPNGLAVDKNGFVYVADTNANRIVKLSPQGKVVLAFGKKGRSAGQFNRPQGIAVAPNGTIYVTDGFNGRVEAFSPRGRFQRMWGEPGIKNGQFQFPKAIAVAPSGNVYVTDFFRIQEFSGSGKLLNVYGQITAFPDFEGIALDRQGNVYVTSSLDNQVIKLSPTLAEIGRIGEKGDKLGQFNSPTGIAVDSAGTLYVADSFNDRIEKIAPDGTITAFGTFGYGRTELLLPAGIAVDARGDLYVADTYNNRIKKLASANGTIRAIWGKFATVAEVLVSPAGVAADNRGHVYVTDQRTDRIQVRSARDGHVEAILGYHGNALGQKGKALGQFYSPHGIIVDPSGAIYVADANNGRIQILSNRGPIGAIGSFGHAPGMFTGPYAVAVDRQGNLLVADTFNNRVQKLTSSGTPIWTFGGSSDFGTGPGQMEFPYGVAVDSKGNVYVADWGGGRIDKLSSDGKLLDVWGKQDNLGNSRFSAPQGLAVDAQDNLYVADSGHDAVQKLSPDGQVLQVFDVPGPQSNVTAVSVDSKGVLYVTDEFNSRIVKIAPTGEILDVWS